MNREKALALIDLPSQASFQEIADACVQRKILLEKRLAKTLSPVEEQECKGLRKEAVFLFNFFIKKNGVELIAGINDKISDRFEIRKVLGFDSISILCAGFDRIKKRKVALKLLLPENVDQLRDVDLYLQEIGTCCKLSHPGIVQIFGIYQENDFQFVVLELMKGRSLQDEINFRNNSNQVFNVDEVAAYAQQLSDALDYCCDYLFHRSIIPKNIFITKSGEVKLFNFAVDLLKRQDLFVDKSDVQRAAFYKAPEQLNDNADVSVFSQQYSLSVLIYELLTGYLPMGRGSSLRQRRADVPIGFSDAVKKALNWMPEQRFPNLTAFIRALKKKGKGKQVSRFRLLSLSALFSAFFLALFVSAHPEWRMVIKSEIQVNAEKISDIRAVTSSYQQAWLTLKAVTSQTLPSSVQQADEIFLAGDKAVAADNSEKALHLFDNAASVYAETLTKYRNKYLEKSIFESQIRIEELNKFFDESRAELLKRVQVASQVLEKNKASGDENTINQSREKHNLLVALHGICKEKIFENKRLSSIKEKMLDSAELMQRKKYFTVLEIMEEYEDLLRHLLPQVEQVENVLKLRQVIIDQGEVLSSLSVKNVHVEDSFIETEKIQKQAEADFSKGNWLEAAELFQAIIPSYKTAVIQGRKGLVSMIRDQQSIKMKSLGFEMIYVSGGCYQMGDIFSESHLFGDEYPVHEVCVDDFEIGKYEVTQGLWRWVMGENPARFKKGDNFPVEQVSWIDVQKFLEILNDKTGQHFRLPTEAEWEYAARSGGEKEIFSGGDDVGKYAWHGENSGGSTHQVGEKSPNNLGVYDMSGNVYEWCLDWYEKDYYVKSPRSNPRGPDDVVMKLLRSSRKVFRGGSWDSSIYYVRNTYRSNRSPEFSYNLLGLRLVKSAQ